MRGKEGIKSRSRSGAMEAPTAKDEKGSKPNGVHVEEAVGVDDGGVLSDAELAWRLHQELNAGPATLRTRMRKTTSGPGSGSSAPADANDMPEVSKRSSKAAGKGAPRGDRSEGNSAPAVKPESDHNEQEVKEEQVEPAKKAAPEAEGKGETTKEEEEPVSPRALRHQHRDTEPKAKQQSGNDAVKPAPAPVHRSRKGRPEPATEEGAPAPAPPAAKPAAARKPARPIKIPKLPMVLQAKQWYRARVLKETSEKVLVEFAGYEHVLPSLWLPRDSDRIWFGSYKGKDWRYLGEGAWEPKAGIKNRIVSAGNVASESGKEEAPAQTQAPAPKANGTAAGGGRGRGVKREAPAESDSQPDDEQEGEEKEAAAEAGSDDSDKGNGHDGAAASKKARRGAHPGAPRGRRLDPIVREAMNGGSGEVLERQGRKRAAAAGDDDGEGGEDGGSDPMEADGDGDGDGKHESGAGAAHGPGGSRRRREVKPTPTPDTPSGRLAVSKGSLTPGGPQPTSPQHGGRANGGRGRRAGSGGEEDGRRRRGRPPGSYGGRAARGEHHGSDSERGEYGGGRGGPRGGSDSEEIDEGYIKRMMRPKRASRRAAIYNDDEYAVDAEVDMLEPEHPGWYYVPAEPQDAAAHGNAHHAYDAFGSGELGEEFAGGEGGQPMRRRRKPLVLSPAPTDVGGGAHSMPVDPAEYEALAALAEMPSPRSLAAQQAQRAREALLDAYASGGATSSQADGSHGNGNGVQSKRRGALPPLAPPSGAVGRPRKQPHQRAGYPLGRSLSHSAAMEGRHGAGSVFRRSSSLDSLSTAQQMFGRLLGAISTRLERNGSLPLDPGPVSSAGLERSTSLMLGSSGSGSMRLFSNSWSQHKWASGVNGANGTPSILTVPEDLFKVALSNGGSMASAAPAAAAGPAATLEVTARPPVPLFC